MIDIEIRTSRELAMVVRRLSDDSLRREIQRGLRAGAKPVRDAGRRAARERLPKAGGLNDYVADATFGIQTNLGTAHPTVRIVVNRKGHDLKAIDDGVVRHPTWGHRDRWVTQRIAPHVVTDGMREAAPEARAELAHAVDEWARRLT